MRSPKNASCSLKEVLQNPTESALVRRRSFPSFGFLLQPAGSNGIVAEAISSESGR